MLQPQKALQQHHLQQQQQQQWPAAEALFRGFLYEHQQGAVACLPQIAAGWLDKPPQQQRQQQQQVSKRPLCRRCPLRKPRGRTNGSNTTELPTALVVVVLLLLLLLLGPLTLPKPQSDETLG